MPDPHSLPRPSVEVGGRIFYVEVAATDADRIKGLSGHPPLAKDHGMVFLFEKEQILSFWMKDMLFPLDIAFIDMDWRIVDIKRDFPPCLPESCISYTAIRPAQFVLEVEAGGLKGIEKGAKVSFRDR